MYIANLGCPKNEVDSEVWLENLTKSGFKIVRSPEKADFLFVNTCAFIEDARKESAEVIEQMGELKQRCGDKKILVVGCWAQKEGEKLFSRFPFIDAVLGNLNILESCNKFLETYQNLQQLLHIPYTPGGWYPLENILPRTYPFAYLKIAEGCDNRCSYCVLPSIKQSFRSVPLDKLVEQATLLARNDYREIILIGQDITRYGQDLGENIDLPLLLNKLNSVEGDFLIRLMYLHPLRVTKKLIETILSLPKVINYLDIPLQHYDSEILKDMDRGYDSDLIEQMLEMIKSYNEDFTLRTTFITGFPGETDKKFDNLLQFVSRGEFLHLGVFSYSPEMGTEAYNYSSRVVPQVIQLRKELIEMTQDQILLDKNRKLENKVVTALVDGHTVREDISIARMNEDAPQIDRHIRVQGMKSIGERIRVRIIKALPHDFLGIMEE